MNNKEIHKEQNNSISPLNTLRLQKETKHSKTIFSKCKNKAFKIIAAATLFIAASGAADNFASSKISGNPTPNTKEVSVKLEKGISNSKHKETIIAIIDTEINAELAIFKDKLIDTPNLRDNLPMKDHGTMVCSAALNVIKEYPQYNNSIKIMPIIGAKEPFEDTSKAIRYAVDSGAKIINFSTKFETMDSDTQKRLQEAVDYAYGKNVIVVAAAGNDGPKYSESSFASLNHVIAVGSVDRYGNAAEFSNAGEYVFCSDLGVDVKVTDIAGQKFEESGTSFSAPRLAAKISVILRKYYELYPDNPDLTVDQIKQIIAAYSKDLDKPGKDHKTGYGLFNPDLVDLSESFPQVKDFESPNVIGFTGVNSDKQSSQISFRMNDVSEIDISDVRIKVKSNVPGNPYIHEEDVAFSAEGNTFSFELSNIPDGEYEVTISDGKDIHNNELGYTKRYYYKDTIPPKANISYSIINIEEDQFLNFDVILSDETRIDGYCAFWNKEILQSDKIDRQTADKTSTFNCPISPEKLTPGEHEFVICYSDGSNVSYAQYVVSIDNNKNISIKQTNN